VSSFGVTAAMEQLFKSLTRGEVNGYKRSSTSLGNSHTLAVERFSRGQTKEPHRSPTHLVKRNQQRSRSAFTHGRKRSGY